MTAESLYEAAATFANRLVVAPLAIMIEFFGGERCRPMAWYDLRQEYHLTPNGWVEGTVALLGNQPEERTPPPDRILTFVKLVSQSSPYARTHTMCYEVWRSHHVSEEQLNDLKERFPLEPFIQRKPVLSAGGYANRKASGS